jgi:hypothetical protein
MNDITDRLEAAIALYEAEIFGDADPVKLEVLCTAVEAEADRIGYDNHSRLMGLHTMAEQVCVARS